MQKLCFLLVLLLSAGNDAFFLKLFKPKYKQHQSFNYNRAPGYLPPPAHTFGPSYGYKVPVWQAVPSGYNAQPYNPGTFGGSPQSFSLQPPPTFGFSSPPDPNSFANYGYPSSAVKFPSSGYPSLNNPFDEAIVGNSLVGNNLDFTGGRPIISVPVYIPKDGGNLVSLPTIYSNGVSGFYDSSLAGSSSSSVSVLGQVVPVPVPLPSATFL